MKIKINPLLKRRSFALFAFAALTVGLAVPGGGIAARSPNVSRPAAARSAPDEVRLGYFANITHAQAVLGVDAGDFEITIAPARLVTRTFNAGPSLIEALFAGEIDIGYVGPSPALSAFFQSRGEGIRVVAGSAANGVAIVAGPNSGIDSLDDLKDKVIATPQLGNTQDVSAKHYLLKVLGQKNTDNVIAIPNAEQVAMMARGEIEAAWAVEPWAARLVAEAGGTIIAEEKDLWEGGEFVLTCIVVRPEFLAEHPEVVEKVLRVHREWTARLQQDAEAQVPALTDAMEALTGKRLSSDIISDALSRVKFTDAALDETLATFARWAYELGFSRHAPTVDGLVDTTILRRLEKEEAARTGTDEGDDGN
jgi:NitT/TauT family transport system substrate-binding protein